MKGSGPLLEQQKSAFSQPSLLGHVKTSPRPRSSVPVARALYDAARAVFLQRHVCVCLHVAGVTGPVVPCIRSHSSAGKQAAAEGQTRVAAPPCCWTLKRSQVSVTHMWEKQSSLAEDARPPTGAAGGHFKNSRLAGAR